MVPEISLQGGLWSDYSKQKQYHIWEGPNLKKA